MPVKTNSIAKSISFSKTAITANKPDNKFNAVIAFGIKLLIFFTGQKYNNNTTSHLSWQRNGICIYLHKYYHSS